MKKFLVSLLIVFLACTSIQSQSIVDSTIPKKDSSVPIVHKKRIRARPVPDTLNKIKTGDSLIIPSVSIPVSKNWMDDLKHILSEHPYFNFSGKAITRPEIKRVDQNNDLIFYLLLALFFYFALIKTLFSKYVNNLVAIFLRITLKQQQLREQLLQAPLPSMFLNVLFVLTGGLYTSLILDYFQVKVVANFWLQTAWCILLLTVIYSGKLIILKTVGWIFNISKATDTYIFIVFLVNKMLGIFLLPFLVLIVFEPADIKQLFVTLSLIFIIFLIIYRFAFSFRPLQNEIRWSLLQFFIYLCAFEIAPLILIYKVLLAIVKKSN